MVKKYHDTLSVIDMSACSIRFVIIVPYRDRAQLLSEFQEHMRVVLADVDPATYRVWYLHQQDSIYRNNNGRGDGGERPFNRGAMKNIGFLVLREMYPTCYRNITLVFHDVDTVPTGAGVIPDYTTVPGTVKHFYGYSYALGGIVSITAGDFERIGGFPNYWAWGYEDNMLQTRAKQAGLRLDRSVFYPIGDAAHIRQVQGGRFRTVNRGEFDRYMRMNPEGWATIQGLVYAPPKSCGLATEHEGPGLGEMVDVCGFDTGYVCNPALNIEFDTAYRGAPFTVGRSAKKRARMNLIM